DGRGLVGRPRARGIQAKGRKRRQNSQASANPRGRAYGLLPDQASPMRASLNRPAQEGQDEGAERISGSLEKSATSVQAQGGLSSQVSQSNQAMVGSRFQVPKDMAKARKTGCPKSQCPKCVHQYSLD